MKSGTEYAAKRRQPPLIYGLTADIDESAKDMMLEAGFKKIFNILDTNTIKEIMENAGLVFKPHGKNLKGKSPAEESIQSASVEKSQSISVSIEDDDADDESELDNL